MELHTPQNFDILIFFHKLWILEENYFFHLCLCINFIFLLICTSVVYSMKWKTKNEENSENLRLCCGCETLLDSDFDLWPMKLWEFPPIASFLLLSVNVEQLTLSLFIHMATTMPCFLNKVQQQKTIRSIRMKESGKETFLNTRSSAVQCVQI